MEWLNEYDDVIDDAARESFIQDEMANDQDAGGDATTARDYAERVFNRTHRDVSFSGPAAELFERGKNALADRAAAKEGK